MTKSDIENLIKAIGFKPNSSNPDLWSKSYSQHSGYVLELDLADSNLSRCSIKWGSSITCGRGTTSNFSQPETLVVLECVNRLLEHGYSPSSLTVEKKFSIAHGDAYLDVLVSKGADAYLMIECKTHGKEYAKERASMLVDGAQLFGYYVQDRKAQFLALYSSKLAGAEVEFKYEVIETSRLAGSSKSELWDSWDKSFFSTGKLRLGSQQISRYADEFLVDPFIAFDCGGLTTGRTYQCGVVLATANNLIDRGRCRG